jgi:AraC-like DNA-binding protein
MENFMPKQAAFNQLGSLQAPDRAGAALRLALDEYELATRWGLSVKTLRRWRQEQLGCAFCKLGSRVVYLLTEIEAFERRVSRHSTFARAFQ